jgi:hypothetical protein
MSKPGVVLHPGEISGVGGQLQHERMYCVLHVGRIVEVAVIEADKGAAGLLQRSPAARGVA